MFARTLFGRLLCGGAAVLTLCGPALAQETPETPERPAVTQQPTHIAAIAGQTRQLAKFNQLLEASGLAATLSEEGPFTVLAPSNEAFKKLGKEQFDELLLPASKERLVNILKHHVIKGRTSGAELGGMETLKPMFGRPLVVAHVEETLTVDGAKVVKPDLAASNGVLHVIDTVLLPPADTEPAAMP